MLKEESNQGRLALFFALVLWLGIVVGLILESTAAAADTHESASSRTARAMVTLDYNDPETCELLGGKVEKAGPEGTFRVCSEINRIDTFCIVDSRGAFPCRGLFKHVVECNDKHNRPAENIGLCAEKCPSGYFACGDQCGREGEITPPKRILYVLENYRGEIFPATAEMTLGMAKFRVESPDDPVMTVFAEDGMTVAVGVHAAVLAAGEYSATLRADFSCAGLAQESAEVDPDYYPFTITVFSPPSTLTMYFEAGDGKGDGGQPSIPGIKQLSLERAHNYISRLDFVQGTIQFFGTRPPAGSFLTAPAIGHSPEFLGSLALTVRAEFYHPFDPIFGPDHCRTPGNKAAGCVDNSSCQPNEDLLKSIPEQNDSLFCQALREGADVSVAITTKDELTGFVIKHESPLLFALSVNRLDLARTLTLNGARPDQYDDFEGGGLLNHAAFYGSAMFARWLLEEVKQDPNEITGDNVRLNPLHRLAQRDLGDDGDAAAVAQLLIDNHVDPNAPTDGWVIPSIGYRDSDVSLRAINIMTQDRPGGRAPDHRSLPILLPNGMDASHVSPDRRGRRLLPLTHAAENDYVHVISLLAGAAHVNQRNPGDGGSPLHYARSPKAVDLLLAGGASLDYAPDMPESALRGRTPLDAMVDFYLTTTLEFAGTVAARQRAGLLHLNRLGGQCNQNRAPGTNRFALCLPFSPLASEFLTTTTRSVYCGTPESSGGAGSSFYKSACYLECNSPGYETAYMGVYYCHEKANDGAEALRECNRKTRRALSCDDVKWTPSGGSNTGGN